MTPQERRRQGTSRVIPMREDDGAFDRASWEGTSVPARLEALWDLTLDYLAWTAPMAVNPDSTSLLASSSAVRLENLAFRPASMIQTAAEED